MMCWVYEHEILGLIALQHWHDQNGDQVRRMRCLFSFFLPCLPVFSWYQCRGWPLENFGANLCVFLAQLSCQFVKIVRVVIGSVEYCLHHWRNRSIAKVSPKSSLAYWCLLHQIEPLAMDLIPNCLRCRLLCVMRYCAPKTLLHLHWSKALPPLLFQFIVETMPQYPIFLPLYNSQYIFPATSSSLAFALSTL